MMKWFQRKHVVEDEVLPIYAHDPSLKPFMELKQIYQDFTIRRLHDILENSNRRSKRIRRAYRHALSQRRRDRE
jgi:hypothetical protein